MNKHPSKMTNSTVLLCTPPRWENFDYPTLSTPSLTGYLQERGIDVRQWDINIAFREFLRSKITVQSDAPDAPPFHPNNLCLSRLSELFLRKYQFKDQYYSSYLDPRQGFSYTNIVTSAFSVLSQFIRDEQANIYYQFYAQKNIIAQIEQMDVSILGISITSESQVIAAFSLAHLVKNRLPSIHVTIGGAWVMLFWKTLVKSDTIDFFDTLVISEGEYPLEQLVHNLMEGREPSCVPNLIKRGDAVQQQSRWFADMSQLPPPSFEGLLLSSYDKPKTLTYQTTRGCYWDKCTFCEHRYVQACTYRQKPIEQVLKDITILIERYQVQTILFTDTALSPKRFRQIAEGIIREGIKVSWWCFARLEKKFTSEIFKVGQRSGCICIQFGLESTNNRVLSLMQKGVDIETASRVIKECHMAGIKVVVGALLGFPTETRAEAQQTLDFLMTHREFIDYPTVNVFRLRRDIPIYHAPTQYKVQIKETHEERLKFVLDYVSFEGICTEEAEQLKKQFYATYWPSLASIGHIERFDKVLLKMPILSKEAYIYRLDFQILNDDKPVTLNILSYADSVKNSTINRQLILGKDVLSFLKQCDGKHTVGQIMSILAYQPKHLDNEIIDGYMKVLSFALEKGFITFDTRETTPSPYQQLKGLGLLNSNNCQAITDLISYFKNENVVKYQDLLWGICNTTDVYVKQSKYVDFIASQIDHLDSKIMDCGSGTGNLTLSLAARGYQVTGLEISNGFIAQARRKLSRENVAIRERVKFIEGNLRDFKLTESFDIACFSLHTFGFSNRNEQLQVLRNVRQHLSGKGKLIIINFNYPLNTEARKWSFWKSITLKKKQALLSIYSRVKFDKEDNCFVSDQDWILFDQTWQGKHLLQLRNVRETYLKRSELHNLLSDVGFNQITFYGSLDGQPYHIDSQLLIAIAND